MTSSTRQSGLRDSPRRRVAERHPALYPLAVRYHQLRRHLAWARSGARWVTPPSPTRPTAPGPSYRVKKHASLLLRQLGEEEMWLQHNKVHNLRLACTRIDTVVIRPGETFSFNRLVGNCTRRRGYVDGMKLSNGKAHAGTGGGICQLANLLVWMFMHSDLTMVERSQHSFDPFPDNGRVLPWGVGCSIVWNYVDLVVRNDTDASFTVRVGVGDRYLEGELRSDREPTRSFSVHARAEGFEQVEGRWFRHNEIWREVIDRRTGEHIGAELLRRNRALVTYEPEAARG
ncbi:hypothetical protein GCM10011519_10770 [Marmoricola endophyticus]|uniref:Vancomycin resistance protein n=1 Tax=Marmoricola endophyticus TaxID=2040280 RepID=A0A917BF98_9ACTN|nr:VanW family protein [Marmoricola endophyticus]GGF38997.1 hypothetical protein GCM10011519_10770 [Marmoricola endophyticus]